MTDSKIAMPPYCLQNEVQFLYYGLLENKDLAPIYLTIVSYHSNDLDPENMPWMIYQLPHEPPYIVFWESQKTNSISTPFSLISSFLILFIAITWFSCAIPLL